MDFFETQCSCNFTEMFSVFRPSAVCGQVTGLSVSTGPDQLFCIHLTTGNDFVLCLQSRRDPGADLTGEAVGVLVRLFQQ